MAPSVTKELDRSLGLGSVFSIAVGAMLGSGIFVLPGLAAAIAGPWVCLSYLLAGLLVLPAVLSKAEMATAMPVAGGTYVYVERSMGPWLGTITGLGTWFALSAKTAFALVGLSGYLVLFTDISPQMIALSILAAMVLLNMLGASKASGLQQFIVYTCLIVLAVFIGMGVMVQDPALREPAFPAGAAGILSGAGFVFVSYNGVTKICSVAEEIRNPARNIPLGMLMAQGVVMVLYGLVSWVITSTVSYEALATDLAPVATAAGVIAGPTARVGMAIIAVAALTSMCNAGVMATARFPFAMGRDGSMPRVLTHISKRFGTPIPAILLTALLLVLLVTVFPVVKLAKLASGFTIFIFCIVNLAVILFRETGARWYRPTFRSPFYPFTQIAGIIGGVWLLYNLGLLAIVGVGAATVVGSLWYWFYVRRNVDRSSSLRHLWGQARVLEQTRQAEFDEERLGLDHPIPRVIVPVFGGEPAPSRLVQLAASFVEHGKLEVLRLEEVPDQASLTSFLKADEEVRQLAARAAQIGEEEHLDVEFHDVVTHNAKAALQHHATITRAEWIVMEWPTRNELHYLVRHPLAWWADHPPCDLAIFLDRAGPFDGDTRDDFQKILILAEPGPYDSLLVHAADRLALSQIDATVTLFMPMRTQDNDMQISQMTAYHEQLASLCAMPCASRIERGADPFTVISKVSRDYDILLIGAPPERPLYNLFFRTREDRAAQVAQCSVLKIKAPRHRLHHRFELRREDTQDQMILAPHLQHAIMDCKLSVHKKAELFKHVGERFQLAKLSRSIEPVVRALVERERRQNTALREGVAISAPTVESLEFTQVVVITMQRAIDYESSGRPMVDVLLLVLAPSSDRQMQLWVLERLARMALRTPLLEQLRQAKSVDEMRDAILAVAKKHEI
jgi:amino acid transporter/mannitol/fructose-specific phosphotransferase system IIA component (Ntr-type)